MSGDVVPPRRAAARSRYQDTKVVLIGALNTDICVIGVPRLPSTGEDAFGPRLHIGPGGKSRNMAEIMTILMPPNSVAMISHTTRDPFGLWRIPYDSLRESGANIDFVTVVDHVEGRPYPAVALVTVDAHGNRFSSVNNAIINELGIEAIEQALPLLDAAAAANNGMLVLSLEIPVDTAAYAMRLAAERSLRVALDPGGLPAAVDCDVLFRRSIFLVKPNEHEARRLTGVEITGFAAASRAADLLRLRGVENVLITHGRRGAYLFGDGIREHIMAPEIDVSVSSDATGCGDQVMATLCGYLWRTADLLTAARSAVVAGTLQFSRVGARPVAVAEIDSLVRSCGWARF